MTTSLNQNKQIQSSQKMDDQNQDNFNHHNDSNKPNYNFNNIQIFRKTSKRRQAQEEKAGVLDLFKELLSIVNQKFKHAYESPPKPKLPKTIKIQKQHSRINKRQQKRRQQSSFNQNLFPSHPNAHSQQQSSQKKQKQLKPISQEGKQRNQKHLNNHINHGSHRKGSQSHGYKQRSLNQKNQLLKEHLKRQILENYTVLMKYVIHHQEMDQQDVHNNKHNQQASKQHKLQSQKQHMQQPQKSHMQEQQKSHMQQPQNLPMQQPQKPLIQQSYSQVKQQSYKYDKQQLQKQDKEQLQKQDKQQLQKQDRQQSQQLLNIIQKVIQVQHKKSIKINLIEQNNHQQVNQQYKLLSKDNLLSNHIQANKQKVKKFDPAIINKSIQVIQLNKHQVK